MNEFFFQLTPERVLESVEAAGLAPTGHCQQLNSFENRVYDLKLDGDAHIVVKFYRPGRWSRAQILEEHEFLRELREHDVPVCAPREFPGGGTLRETDGIFYAVWPRTGGRALDEVDDEQTGVLGRLVARIHNVGAAAPARHRLTLDVENYALRPLAYLEEHEFLPAHLEERYRRAVESTVDYYEALSRGVATHRIHGDCHAGNLLYGEEGWFFLDFDDSVMGPAVQDVWMLLPARDTEGLRKRSIFLEEYRRFRDFDDASLRLIEPLRALRYIHYAAWIARRWEDPAFPEAFPHFGTDEYWENETRDLEAQVALFGRENPDLAPSEDSAQGENEAELTNADFFWDWDKK